MSSSLAGRVGEEHAAYRKGLVLGLTMAEVGILIIFVLLLLIALQQLSHDRAAGAFKNKEAIDAGRLAHLESADATLQEIAQVLKVETTRPNEDFTRLVRVVAAAAATPDARTSLEEANRALVEIKEAALNAQNLVSRAAPQGAEGVAREIEIQSYRLANQEGQLKRFENQLRDVGNGKGERPCWVQPDGKIDYLYDVILTSEGVRMREYQYPSRSAERALLPMPSVDPMEALSESEFLRRTAPLYSYSENANCRFFVVIYDGTAEHEKPLYKRLLRTVEGHFYKRNADGAAPF